MPADWLADRRTEAAADRILDAAEDLFRQRDAADVGMNEIARAAGCSRATLYRYFENRDALHTAYVHREAQRLYGTLTDRVAAIPDPAERLVEGMLTAVASVRANPALSSWFAPTARPIGGEMAERSEVVPAMVAAFVRSLGAADDDSADRQARWLVRVLTSLLMFPGRNASEERAMLEEFVAPVVLRLPSTPGP
ncbi:TetR family transcriptional regulator [Mycobacterium sp. 852013-51886_SCH5428379]|uniref:TetR/AcrR family transcriptional regulator n=1 Tax=Mycobacterium sp. 852013-51886_SCH5428379 TaxID=1834111 RepID=UPI0007FD1811|nr:TetR/AcrR family transcriptional regulator [Mycobacterium sp. 852013-51886_SCH5428379]OBB61118.1 TetR family transcriptional regulator [Mycobacterium sp. 852013-51886_SCH5428379]